MRSFRRPPLSWRDISDLVSSLNRDAVLTSNRHSEPEPYPPEPYPNEELT